MVGRVLLAWLCLSWLTAQGTEEVPPKTDARQLAAKKLDEARRALRSAIAELSAAERESAAASEETARHAAEKKAADARQKLGAARREVARQNSEALKVAQAVAQLRYVPGNGMRERESADPQDPVERFALLTPGGPLVVQAALTIDGQPFRLAREKLIDTMLAAADKDQDGTPTWEEALAAPRFTLGQVRLPPGASTAGYVQSFDTIANGLVDREEVRHFVARTMQGPAFLVGGPMRFRGGVVVVNGRVVSGGGQVDVLALLDADSDGSLDKLEIAAARDRLRSRDADDNDVLEAASRPPRPRHQWQVVGGGAGAALRGSPGINCQQPLPGHARVVCSTRQGWQ
jgi:hypothetical protein